MTDQLGGARLFPIVPISRRRSPWVTGAAVAVAGLDAETASAIRAPGGGATSPGQLCRLTGPYAPAVQPAHDRSRG